MISFGEDIVTDGDRRAIMLDELVAFELAPYSGGTRAIAIVCDSAGSPSQHSTCILILPTGYTK